MSGTRVEDGVAEFQELGKYQASSADSRIDGGFHFGLKDGRFLPYVNPVSTVFALQAMEMWREHESGSLAWDYRKLI
jgi:hypothetical protein